MLPRWGWVKITGSGLSPSELRAWPLRISLSGIWKIPNLRAYFLCLQPSVSPPPPPPANSLRIKCKPLPLTHHLVWALWSPGITQRCLCVPCSHSLPSLRTCWDGCVFFFFNGVQLLYSVVSFYCTTKSISYTYTYIPSFLNFLPF